MKIQPYIVGSGRAAQALLKSVAVLEITDSIPFEKPIHVKRGQSLKGLTKKSEFSILFLANPHALHAPMILEADGEFQLIVTEKPVCTSLEEIEALKKLKTPVAVCHGYRQSWGIQSLKKMIDSGEFGEIVTIEGRYWQSSTAQRALDKKITQSWKNDPALSGPYDVLVDTATHWADVAVFLMPEKLIGSQAWISYANAEAKHRDSHVQLFLSFDNGKRATSSISKIVHGAANHFEVNVIGTKKFATWKFLEADIIEIAEGSKKTFHSRSEIQWGSQQGAHHGMGWLEGYIEIIRQSLMSAQGKSFQPYPNLEDGLKILECLLNAQRI